MKEFTHYILTRYNTMLMPDGLLYNDKAKAKKWMDERMPLFEACKESVLSQEGDFEWIISLDKRTPNRYVQKIVTDDRIKIVHCDIRDALKEEEILTPYVITTRLDCDDQYKPGTIKAIQRKFRPRLRTIDIGFTQLDWWTGKEYTRYWDEESPTRRAGSMFISLVEPTSRIMTVYCRPHGQVSGGYPMSGSWHEGWGKLIAIEGRRIEDKLALMVCHGGNITNKIAGREI